MNKFKQIFHDLKLKIQNKEYENGTYLPSENELAKQYQTSRETIRKALNLLLEHGYIQKIRGKGSIVISPKQFNFPVSGLTSYQELVASQHLTSQTTVLSNNLIKTIDTIKKHSELTSPNGLRYIKRQRWLDGSPVIIDHDYFHPDIIPEIPNEVAEQSIYEYLENSLGLAISYATKTITVEAATQDDVTYLGHQDYVVVVRSDVYLEDTQLFQYTESRHTIDKFKFVDFARRRHN
ncbi:trehalose operon repressor [Vagococcus zengguangii]|uniref:Trehalose operon repressor n=1 Tax=Vagococcus zengguangii TaxID=2571750 RepID=A0A4D7CNM1_9ENTE|nr:trehalose operon repressor [Vagococcus zengguangii]QCI85675.1 trehalose operon repressor [Vagococcus zengguangii]TLG81615.1 trehalose operon repressor [Vagococcus zengguangii]